jgi:Uma2 family endonuclease
MNRPELKLPEVHYPESDGKPRAESDLHRNLMVESIDTLCLHFRDDPGVYVSGNLLVYFEEGNPQASVAPDLMVVRGVGKHPRKTFKVWEEAKGPDFVLEVTSPSTHREDLGSKRGVYEELQVQEYFLFDPTGSKFQPPLRGFRLRGGAYEPVMPREGPDGVLVLPSEALGLELHVKGDTLRWVDPETRSPLPTAAEAERLRAEAERQRAETERQRADAERQRAERAEAEIAKLREELARARPGGPPGPSGP